jgi:hypothetical protein
MDTVHEPQKRTLQGSMPGIVKKNMSGTLGKMSCAYVHSRVDSNTFTMGQPFSTVDFMADTHTLQNKVNQRRSLLALPLVMLGLYSFAAYIVLKVVFISELVLAKNYL